LESSSRRDEHPAVAKAKQFYAACLSATDVPDGEEELNMKPMLERLFALGSWPMATSSWDPLRFDWQRVAAHFLRSYMLPVLFQVTVDADRKNTSRNVIIVDQVRLLTSLK